MIVPIYPKLDGATAERFPAFARRLQAAQLCGDRRLLADLLRDEVEWCEAHSRLGDQRLIYEVCVRVLTDLVRLRWRLVEQGYGFALENPKEMRRSSRVEELIASKSAIREELRPVVDEQLAHPAVQGFRRRLEAEARGRKSIRLLIADRADLERRLAPARGVSGEARVAALRGAVRPYLQRASETPDHVTGHSLREIWRYFRYSWSIPQVPTPGRQLLYLVRDAAHPNHPVMGITSLNNCPLEMGETREAYIGWHRRALEKRFIEAASQGSEALECEVAWIEARLAASLEEVDWTKLVTFEEVQAPTPDVLKRLNRRYLEFIRLREEVLRDIADDAAFAPDDWGGEDSPPVDDEILRMEAKASVDNRMHAARKRLVAKKRAYALRRLLEARLTLRIHRAALITPETTLDTLRSEAVNSAINIVLEALKGRRAGANLLEITTCGAVDPYGPYLGGKLAALLMLSPEVGADYRALYDSPSIISSQMKNQPVTRDNTLALLGTTSLYVHGSSQYNRLRLPEGTIAADQSEIRYWKIGQTTGFGTVQFSPDTSRAIDAWLSARDSFKEVNSVFGEGTSPKLRKIKMGLRTVGFDPDRLLNHRQQRLIYAAPLWDGARDWLTERTIEKPSYVADPSAFRDASERIAEFWRSRWLASRLNSLDASEPTWRSEQQLVVERSTELGLTG